AGRRPPPPPPLRTLPPPSHPAPPRRPPHGPPPRAEPLAGEVPPPPRHDPQQRALPGAVVPEHADLRPGVEREPDALQDLLALGGDLAEILHGEDELRHGRAPSTRRGIVCQRRRCRSSGGP